MDSNNKIDNNLTNNKEYIKKFYKKTEEEIKKQTGEGKIKEKGR